MIQNGRTHHSWYHVPAAQSSFHHPVVVAIHCGRVTNGGTSTARVADAITLRHARWYRCDGEQQQRRQVQPSRRLLAFCHGSNGEEIYSTTSQAQHLNNTIQSPLMTKYSNHWGLPCAVEGKKCLIEPLRHLWLASTKCTAWPSSMSYSVRTTGRVPCSVLE